MKKILISLIATIVILNLGYLFALPTLVSNQKVLSFIENSVNKSTNCFLQIENPHLQTSIKPTINFDVERISLTKDNKDILIVQDLDTSLSFNKLLKRIITLNKFELNYFFVDTNELNKIFPSTPKQETKESKPLFNIDFLDAHLAINDFEVITSLGKGINAKVNGKNLEIEKQRNPKYVRFHIDTIISKGNEKIKIALDDNDRFFIDKKQLIVKNGILDLNKSRIFINTIADNEDFTLSLNSNEFSIGDLVNIIKSNIFIPNGSELLAETLNVNGIANFKITLNKQGINGDINLEPTTFNIKSLNKLPIKVNEGIIKLTPNNVYLKEINGYYGAGKQNRINVTGDIQDYLKIAKANLEIKTVLTDDFTRNYLSKIIGLNVTMTGFDETKTFITVKTIGTDVDIYLGAKIDSGNDILIENASFSPISHDRAISMNMYLRNNILKLDSLKYFIAKELDKGSIVKPILTFGGNFDLAQNGEILDCNFVIPKPLPSEFLNLFAGAKTFQKGLISGDIKYTNNGIAPRLDGELSIDKTFVPKARLYINDCTLSTDSNHINITADGKYRKGNYKLDGKILNKLLLPIIIPSINFDLDFINIKKVLESFVSQEQTGTVETNAEKEFMNNLDNNDSENAAIVFLPNIVEIQQAQLSIQKGKYKKIKFNDFVGTATLNRDGTFKAASNIFDFADGKAKAELDCNLAKNKFGVKLIGEMVDSDILATSLLNLKKEITGKACGLILLNTDETLKLNGSMDFIVDQGTIEKVGLVEYALNFLAIFRNPLSMLSPTILLDMVNIPEGNFDRIKGKIIIKNNIITNMTIQSKAPQLVTLILGWMNLENGDSSLRIYTKFANKSKGFAGFLRKISLSSLSNRLSLGESSRKKYYTTELNLLPELETNEKDSQIYLTTVDGDVANNNFLSSLKRVK